MAGLAKAEFRLPQPSVWFDQLAALLARELAPSSRKLRTALRMTTIATLGAGLITICHVNNQLGTYIVWLLVGAGPMMSFRKAGAFLIAEALALAASVVMARDIGGNAVANASVSLRGDFLFDLPGSDSQPRRRTSPDRGGLSRYLLRCRVCAWRNRLGRGRRIRWQRDRLRHDRAVRQLAVARPRRSDFAGIAGSERRARSLAAARGCKFLSGSPRCSRGRRCLRRLRIFPRTWIFWIERSPRACPSIGMRFCLQLSLAWRASVSKWIA